MSSKLALSSALSVLMMAGFAVFGTGPGVLTTSSGEGLGERARIELPAAPALPTVPFFR